MFELRLLALAGYEPHLLHCSECGISGGEGEVGFDAGRGGALCPSCCGRVLRVDRLTLGTLARCLLTPPELFQGFRLSPRTLIEGEAVLACALRQHLHRPLRSLPFLEEVLPARR